MGNSNQSSDVQTNLEKERAHNYGQAWLVAGNIAAVIQEACPKEFNELVKSRMMTPWFLIIVKLMRILRTPYHEDSWRDIIGYANLVINWLEATGDKSNVD